MVGWQVLCSSTKNTAQSSVGRNKQNNIFLVSFDTGERISTSVLQRDHKRYEQSKSHPLPKKTEEIKKGKETLTTKLIINDAAQFIMTSYYQVSTSQKWNKNHLENETSPLFPKAEDPFPYLVHSVPYEQIMLQFIFPFSSKNLLCQLKNMLAKEK